MPKTYTFDAGNRYMTIGISETIPMEIQLFIWNEIDWLVRGSEKVDYLQVFEIRVRKDYLEIEHRQEVPKYQKIHKIKMREEYKELNDVKIFVIDDIDHSTILLSSEY